MLRRLVLLLLTFALAASLAIAQKSITPAEAKNHIGEQQTVCGKVVSTRFAESSRGKPTFLNLDRPYPDQVFTVVIWGGDRSKFGDPETNYRGHQICVAGRIADYRGIPEIIAQAPSQITKQ
jgi:DNA/RNA endonuclease YhcR with UshA esterase domain